MSPDTTYLLIISGLSALSGFMLVRYGYQTAALYVERQVKQYDQVLCHELMLDVDPKTAFGMAMGGVAVTLIFAWLFTSSLTAALLCATVAFFVPDLLIRHMAQKRRETLDRQITEGLTTLASGARAGLNLVQAMELLVQNHTGPIQQEFGQILREYGMGKDLNQALRDAASRIGSQLYRLTFTAIEMHRVRGGDTAESMDRIAESIREIQRLEGKLDAITSQGRTQAWMMALMPAVFLVILYTIDRPGVELLFVTPAGRIILLCVLASIFIAFFWIRKIMKVDV